MGTRAVAVVAVTTAVVTASCGGHASAGAPTTTVSRPTTPVTPTQTSDDSCYLVRLDLQTLGTTTAATARTTVLDQMTADAATGDAALRTAVAAYVAAARAGRPVDVAPITAAC